MKNSFSPRRLFSLMLMALMMCGVAQARVVSGVVSGNDGETLIGVSVVAKDKAGKNTSSAITDIDGRYRIDVADNGQLLFTYVGYKPETVTVGSKTEINVTLNEDSELLDDVVVIGYGAVKKSDVTGAITSIKAKDIENVASAGIESALQGKVPGMLVTKSSGAPGSTADIRIRGVGSFNSSGPLWVIDGVPHNAGTDFNMNDA